MYKLQHGAQKGKYLWLSQKIPVPQLMSSKLWKQGKCQRIPVHQLMSSKTTKQEKCQRILILQLISSKICKQGKCQVKIWKSLLVKNDEQAEKQRQTEELNEDTREERELHRGNRPQNGWETQKYRLNFSHTEDRFSKEMEILEKNGNAVSEKFSVNNNRKTTESIPQRFDQMEEWVMERYRKNFIWTAVREPWHMIRKPNL